MLLAEITTLPQYPREMPARQADDHLANWEATGRSPDAPSTIDEPRDRRRSFLHGLDADRNHIVELKTELAALLHQPSDG